MTDFDAPMTEQQARVYRSQYDVIQKMWHDLSWKLMTEALVRGLIDSEGDDCPKPKEYGGASALADLFIAEVDRLRGSSVHKVG